MDKNFYCVIMAGGIGSRFWPVSRNSMPKQFLDILGTGHSFLQDTFNLDLPIFIDNITDLGGKTFDKTDKQIIYLQTDNKNHNFEIEQY